MIYNGVRKLFSWLKQKAEFGFAAILSAASMPFNLSKEKKMEK